MRWLSHPESPLYLDPDSLSAEAVGVIETAIGDEHVERCVTWNPSSNETGPSPGLADIAIRVERHADIELPGEDDRVEITVRFRGDGYSLSIVTEDGD